MFATLAANVGMVLTAKSHLMAATNLVNPLSSQIELSEFAVDLSDLDIDVACHSCTSMGFDYIPEIVATMRHRGVSDMVEDRVESMVNEGVRDYWDSLELYQHLWNARLVCPSHEKFNPDAEQSVMWKPFHEFS